MTKGRCFAFGCSFTQWFYPTWADYIGQNYDEFYNYGKGALSNETIGRRFIEVDSIFNFNENDLVLVGLSGIGRYNFLVNRPDGITGLWGAGELKSDALDGYIDTVEKWKPYKHIIRFMRDQYWDRTWGIYHTWLAVKTMKRICESNNVRHIIVMALDNELYKDKELLDLEPKEVEMINDIYGSLTVQESLQVYNETNFENRYNDTHPFIDSHLGYVKKHFPEYVTEKQNQLYDLMYQKIKDEKDINKMYDKLAEFKRMPHYNDIRKLYAEYT